jgi:twinkle protein
MSIDKTLAALDSMALPKVDFLEYLHAREQDTDNVKRPIDFLDEIKARMSGSHGMSGSSMPWTKTHDNFRFRPGEITMWSGYNGHKKSMVLGYISLGFIQQNEPVCIASFEMKPSSTLIRMLKQASGTKSPTDLALDGFLKFADNNLWIYDQLGTVTAERLYGVIFYCADKLKIKHFIIDSLMRVIPGEDSYNAQKDFITRLSGIAKETNTHIHIVHHMRKGNESEPSGRYDAKGSGAISDNIDNSLIVWSVKGEKKNPDMPDTVIKCDKQREGEWEGNIPLWFLEDSLQFVGVQGGMPRTWIR